ncbi:MAG: GNAT family N-acetyltransferase [Eggerthellaceae bacterium]|nr:GNAT family N-acetyltransferase [Eggerthellaceae bacterium]
MGLIMKEAFANTPEAEFVQGLMESAFPKEEQMTLEEMLNRAVSDGRELIVYYDEQEPVGFTLSARTESTVYVLYLAVSPAARSKGYGGQILSTIKERNGGLPLVVDIEPLDEECQNMEQRLRRKAFYEREGFKDTQLFVDDGICRYQVFSQADPFSEEDFFEAHAMFFPEDLS